jgi:hypothetical protein
MEEEVVSIRASILALIELPIKLTDSIGNYQNSALVF